MAGQVIELQCECQVMVFEPKSFNHCRLRAQEGQFLRFVPVALSRIPATGWATAATKSPSLAFGLRHLGLWELVDFSMNRWFFSNTCAFPANDLHVCDPDFPKIVRGRHLERI